MLEIDYDIDFITSSWIEKDEEDEDLEEYNDETFDYENEICEEWDEEFWDNVQNITNDLIK